MRFTCDLCEGEFDTPEDWGDEEAVAEMNELWKGGLPEEDQAVLCDDCFIKTMQRAEDEGFGTHDPSASHRAIQRILAARNLQ